MIRAELVFVQKGVETIKTTSVMVSEGPCERLQPLPRLAWRRCLCCGLLFGLFSSRLDWAARSALSASVAALVGTLVEARIRDGRFERGWVIAFVPLPLKSWPLEQFTQIETEWIERGGLIEALLLGLYGWLISRLCDWALPWFGGHSRIWLRTSSGRRVLAWRGHNSGNFRKNVRKLQQATGLPVRRAV